MARLIEVRQHAIDQFRERFPNENNYREELRQLIAHEVENALTEGRYASKEPRWSREKRTEGKRNNNERDRTLRFCWTEDEERIYLVDKIGTTARVITTIKPSGDDDTLAP